MARILQLTAIITLITIQQAAAFEWKFWQQKRSHINAVGSSTVSPFVATISEEYRRKQRETNPKIKTPVVESTGTHVGFKQFCNGIGHKYPDFVNASKPIDHYEREDCRQHGISEPLEIKIGYDGIVIGRTIGSQKMSLTKEQIFLAIAQDVPDEKTGKLVKNPYKLWSEISPKLPKTEIAFYLPPLTSGTRDVFIDIILEEACFNRREFIKAYPTFGIRKEKCYEMRKDGKVIEIGENDNFAIESLKKNPSAVAVFGFGFLLKNEKNIQAVKIDNIVPNIDNIASKKYGLSRPLFIYFKKEHLNLLPNMREFIKEIISTETIGSKGYLTHSGLVPLKDDELQKIRAEVLSQIN